MSMSMRTHQRGSALIGALFLIVVVAALGAFAINLQSNQRQEQLLDLTQHRVELAAQSGMEAWRHWLANSAACPTSPSPISLGNHRGLSDITVRTLTCTQIANVADMTVFEVEVEATHGNYGDPDFVRRTVHRTIRR